MAVVEPNPFDPASDDEITEEMDRNRASWPKRGR